MIARKPLASPLGPKFRYDRTFYLLLLGGWGVCVALMFMTVVYGGFDGAVERVIRPRELAMTEGAQPLPTTPPPPATAHTSAPATAHSSAPATAPQAAPGKGLEHKAFNQLGKNDDDAVLRAAPIQNQSPAKSVSPSGHKTGTLAAELAREGESLEIRAEKLFGVKQPSPPPAISVAPVAPVAPSAQPAPEPKSAKQRAAAERAEKQRMEMERKAREESDRKAKQEAAAKIAADQSVVTGYRIESAQDRFVLHISASAPVEKYSYFYLDNPRRLAINIFGNWRAATQRMVDVQTGFITKVVVGEHPEYLRFTMLFSDRSSRGQPTPSFSASKDGLVVSVPSPR